MKRMNEKKALYTIIICCTLFLFWEIFQVEKKQQFLIGATMKTVELKNLDQKIRKTNGNFETFFRPSNQPILNTKDVTSLLNDNESIKDYQAVKIDNSIFSNPTNLILNYYSILREAFTLEKGLGAGCGSLGYGITPYLITYNFLSSDYQKKIDYKSYHDSFKNILHLSLLKLVEIDSSADEKKYLIEIETIEGTKNNAGAFHYYYGYLTLKQSEKEYKINDIVLYPEVYLCAPYHGWAYYAEDVINIEYAEWCHLVKEKIGTTVYNQIKTIKFKTYNNEIYVIKFAILSNDTDVLIGQYREDAYGNLVKLDLDTKKCIEKTVSK